MAFNSPARNQILGESFNGRTAGLQPANEGSIPSSSTRFPREAVARFYIRTRRSEKPDKHVRLVPLAPIVTVAEWLRRATVDRSTRVQFSPVTPFSLGGSQVGKASDFESDHAEVRILPSQPPFFSCGRRSTDQDTRLRTGRFGGSNPPARTIFGSSSKGQGAALRRLRFRFDPGRADQRFPERRPTGEVPGCRPGLDEFDSRTLRQLHGDVDKWAKSPA